MTRPDSNRMTFLKTGDLKRIESGRLKYLLDTNLVIYVLNRRPPQVRF
jgi:hypothetical protein